MLGSSNHQAGNQNDRLVAAICYRANGLFFESSSALGMGISRGGISPGSYFIPPRRKLFSFYLIFSLLVALVWYLGVDT
jgi:hypothetical protein